MSARFAGPQRRSAGAKTNRSNAKPPTHAGMIQIAESPKLKAKPLTRSKLQADEELADALIAATKGPSLRPPS